MLSQLIEPLHLILCLFHDPVKRAQLRGRCTLVEQVDVNVLRDRVLATINRLEQGTLATAILAQQAITAAIVELERRVGDEHAAVKGKTAGANLDVAAGRGRRQHARRDAVRQTVLVELVGKTLDFFGVVDFRNGAILGRRGRAAGILALLGLAARKTLFLGLGDHGGRICGYCSLCAKVNKRTRSERTKKKKGEKTAFR